MRLLLHLICTSALLPIGVMGAQSVDTARALGALRDVQSACAADAGALWGRSLCGPIALVDRQTRLVIANDTVPGQPYLSYRDAYVTTLPPNRFIANTSFSWGNREWTMVALPLPRDRYARLALVIHEVFHREQGALGFRESDALNNHLDFRDGRTWLRLEYRALASALDTADQAARARHVESALLFRARRYELYPGSETLEAALEIREGVPEYTGHYFAMRLTGERRQRVARHVRDHERTALSFVRAFAYATGPAIGVLLDELMPTWRTTVRAVRDLDSLLAQAIGFRRPSELVPVTRQRATEYGWDEVDREEAARDSARAPQIQSYKARFVEGPTITFRQTKDSLSWGFDPTALTALDMTSAIYPFASFSAPWGSLNVERNGVLVYNDFSTIRASARGLRSAGGSLATSFQGDGWTLTLNPGWTVRPDPAKSGSYVVTRADR